LPPFKPLKVGALSVAVVTNQCPPQNIITKQFIKGTYAKEEEELVHIGRRMLNKAYYQLIILIRIINNNTQKEEEEEEKKDI